ncbi:putative L-lactate dehydrogenase, Fe-S oxidoreductase subunit YkgE [Acidisarcina polymorpha]|uniref:Putative L-lactate dehydrogenase, Fe-S oxidoreductase subunit YkgE n=1 Tax=Acidisarcina polymorpha TaxID=2211140 RepID=A0A2Z5G3M9_9BACT|nr:(Fe-S)-binding protein [Acidisarcina polymorpha]AXC13630.1 putative L-lactate dehydrogenase, Fe-S oxidoreductase subunit YkgE [Acidisarcina polymorpha]
MATVAEILVETLALSGLANEGGDVKIALFVPCYVDAFFPEVAIATLQLLERLGHEVVVPPQQTCCGQPMANSGDQAASAATEAHFVDTFKSYDLIVGPSGSCVHHVRLHLDACEQTPEAAHVRKSIRELIEFLHEDIKSLPPIDFKHKVGLHNGCTALRGLGHARPSERVHEPDFSKARDLLTHVGGLEIIQSDRVDECCGFGGSFCVTDEAVSSKMGQDRVADFERNGAEYIASADNSCLMHMKGIIDREKRPLKIVHIAQILNGGPFA